MKKIEITINGKKYPVNPASTIYEIVTEKGIDDIPTLCHEERLEPYGSCFVCVVEVEGQKKLLPSCSTRPREGMKIQTRSERVIRARKTALELLFSNHYADCIGPCTHNCPASVDAQTYIALISMGKHDEALQLVKKTNPFPLAIGRVCVRDCETVCRRCIIDEPVAINFLKRYVADADLKDMWSPDIPRGTGKSVAVIGGGPSGLTCAYYLRLQGHRVRVFEKLPELGGMFRYGIPEYRLPKDILDREIQWILNTGIEAECNRELGRDFTLDSLLKEQGFDAVYLAVGAQAGSSMRLEHEDDTGGIVRGVEFLRDCQIKGNPELSGTVIVVGGGNTAIDAARTALRCGADSVKLVYRRSIKEMPAHEAEVKAAREEGVEMHFLSNPKRLIREGDRLKAIECLKMELVDDEKGGRPRPVPIAGSEFTIECSLCISAIGQKVDTTFNDSPTRCDLESWGTLIVREDTFETSVKGVFAGGDAVLGPWTAVAAIGHGRRAAEAISGYLKTGRASKPPVRFYSFKHNLAEVTESELSHHQKIKREKMPELPLRERKENFDEVELGFSRQQAQKETLRCLECGCTEYHDCALRRYADEYQLDISNYVGEVRKYQVDNRHPFISLDANKCINCGRCIRTCSEMLKVSALGFVYRGFSAVARPAMENALMETNCISCGNCIDACPTGAITEKYPYKVVGTLPRENHASICNFCSLGCNLNYRKISDDIYYISNAQNEAVLRSHNQGYLCVKGRFGYRHLQELDRLLKPAIQREGKPRTVSMEEAVQHTQKRIRDLVEKYGPGSIGVFASPKLSNEELYLLNKLARRGIGTNRIHSFSNLLSGLHGDRVDRSIGMAVSTTDFDQMQESDVVVTFNTDFTEENHIIAQKIKSAGKRGARIIEINSNETKLTPFAHLWVDTKRGTNTVLFNGLVREVIRQKCHDPKVGDRIDNFPRLKEQVEEFDPAEVCRLCGVSREVYDEFIAQLVNREHRVTLVTNIDNLKEKAEHDLDAALNYLMLTGRVGQPHSGIIVLRDYSNSTGLMDMGVHPRYLPGYVTPEEKTEVDRIARLWEADLPAVFTGEEMTYDSIRENIRGALVFGENPFSHMESVRSLANVEFLMVCDVYSCESTEQAEVVLPMANHLEKTGSFTSAERRVQRKERMNEPRTGMDNLELINRIYSGFAPAYRGDLPAVILDEIRRVNRYYQEVRPGDIWGRDLFSAGHAPRVKKPAFALFPTSTRSFRQKDQSILLSEKYFVTKIKGKLML